MAKLIKMKRFVEENKTLIIVTALLVLGSGCVGAVQKTGEQLGADAASPITVPIEQGLKAEKTLKDVNQQQLDENAQIEQIK